MDQGLTNLADDALEKLVKQFADPFDCLRELVQNAMDAGTPRVEVWLQYQPTADGREVVEIHIDDFGGGMDETIIDGRLTKMFASTKEDDLTKIGKFGIGFTSVFALEPDAVLLHTLAERFKLTKQVGVLKAENDLPPSDKTREAEQIFRLRKLADDAGLDPAFAEKFLSFIVAEVIRHHEKIRSEGTD